MRIVYRLKQFILLVGDLLVFYASLYLALVARYLEFPEYSLYSKHLPVFTGVFFMWLIINYINGLYDLTAVREKKVLYKRLSETAVMSLIVTVFFFYLVNNDSIAPKRILLLSIFLGYGLSGLWRLITDKVLKIERLKQKIIFVGVSDETQELKNIISLHPEKGYEVAACINPSAELSELSGHIGTAPVYESLSMIRSAVAKHGADIIAFHPSIKSEEKALSELYELLFWNVQITDTTGLYQQITGRIPPSTFSEAWFLDHLSRRTHPMYQKFRTVLDIVAGLFFGTIFILFLPLVAGAIKLTSKGPIFYTQNRVGKSGKPFKIYKFRSMYALTADGGAEVDGVQFAIKEDSRITSFGTFLRKTRLDELPQCINLLKRDTTLIGPRPERPEIVEKLTAQMPYYPLRHMVRPGLTGWAVIHQNYTDTFEASLQKLQYDLFYIKHRSILLDFSILLKTINVIIRFKGQ